MSAAEMLCIMLYRVENLLVVRITVNRFVNFRQFSVRKCYERFCDSHATTVVACAYG